MIRLICSVCIALAWSVGSLTPLQAQRTLLEGYVMSVEDGRAIAFAQVAMPARNRGVYTDSTGYFSFGKWTSGAYQLIISAPGFDSLEINVQLPLESPAKASLDSRKYDLDEVLIEEEENFELVRLNEVEGMGIYAGRKTEVVPVSKLTANLATNNSRQVFARVAGLNIWESDCAGLQLGIGGRGLSPNRTANFNTRQNGYDMSADALGYPESYYSPPMQALERVEVVRGAASLQYGPQFGGMANFIMKDGPKGRKLALEASQTVGSYGFLNSFASVGGSSKKLRYYGFYQYRQGNCWRPNSAFNAHNAYGSLTWAPGSRWRIRAEYTHLNYEAQQPGGLSDVDFEQDPGLSPRRRNFFAVDWNLAALTLSYAFNNQTRIEARNFGLYSGRNALGYRGPVTSLDPYESPRSPEFALERDLLVGDFRNIGQETRLLHKYTL
ncbi:MAG: carboxypeptidase-like regulatory domain-containing protein, partial [Bacteroidota bacterium]